ncbi:beta-L-arabinofuranosidase domain-containing protein [Mucilaginibacter myungsuensis]|uniref:Glycoside hydrolase family 127 protein n=1 Tax=Mucilaginibacter myungsuensis TaxID=649104 RepID=A0A929PX36_9SPHI|nr:beta-L-arabinofuranosidase domain-containing protein [Mucilaginibacter myungsuensis]MBE9661985.1 glycoside hydrolase family 127 protein [Mucilaginibacter myungsuensis]MDN3599582.1 glycoside hydrolase family 127 protein [Mucilaginibacter myungsuensis]
MKLKLIAQLGLTALSFKALAQEKANYIGNRAPLRENPYIELPIGAIKPQGWLREMLVRQRNGATGNLDKLYPIVMNNRNGWLGGDGDQWERGPYWIDGLLPLAYILDDKEMIAKVKPWVEWSIKSAQPDGYFGPAKDYGPEPGVQRDNAKDWWPKMVMLKILKQYYQATEDKRVITLLTNYFKYQLNDLPKHPLDHWTFWAKYREADNLSVVYWLYNITGDKFLLDLSEILHKQGYDFTTAFLNTDILSRPNTFHGVNLAQGIKEPAIYYQQHPEDKYLQALKKGYADLKKYNGTANGMYGGDEGLHGNSPTQGAELCSVVELMFSLEQTLAITGDMAYADHLEKIAFNTLPAQTNEDYTMRQYFQQANQVMLTRYAGRNFDTNHSGTDLCYGLLTGYPCCTSNMHQGWPKFVQNLWYATPDKGLAALIYSSSQVKAKVADGVEVVFDETTNYPFEETIKFTLASHQAGSKTLKFPLHLRIPAWCKKGTIKVNGQQIVESAGNQEIKIDREWKKGDVVELSLPMHVYKNTWVENSISVERGPILYGLKIGNERKIVQNEKGKVAYGATYEEIRPTTPWNYGLVSVPNNKMDEQYKVEKAAPMSNYPWTEASAPIVLKTQGKRIPQWTLYNEQAGPLPWSIAYVEDEVKQSLEDITLVPYGSTKLRISQFPQVRK